MSDAPVFRTIDPATLPAPEVYRHLVSSITPRPIAWVSTISPEGKTNLAPFSFFNGISSNPPSLLFCPANDRHGKKKDTLRNVEATGEFVVHIVNHAHAAVMNDTAALLPYGESEFDKFHVPTLPSTRVKPPRIATAPVAFECRLHRIVRVGEGPLSGNIVIGVIVAMHFAENVLDADGRCDPAKLDTIGRLGGELYSRTTERFSLKRPDR